MASSDSPNPPQALLHSTRSVRKDRQTRGKMLKVQAPLSEHSRLNIDRERLDPVALLDKLNAGRMPDLIPIRWGRMLRSPFAFFRGSAALMAADLMRSPSTGVRVQACGDCHVMNFGAFATPERNIVFDIIDFDETLPAPWEWDIKRLAASLTLVARENGVAEAYAKAAAEAAARAYRVTTERYSQMTILEAWYSRFDWPDLVAKTAAPELAQARNARLRLEMERTIGEYYFPKLAEQRDGRFYIKEKPPVIYHPKDQTLKEEFIKALPLYRQSLQEDKQRLFDRFRLEDIAIKVVGIGSVGTLCGIALLISADGEPLFLQIKEATMSVLEPYSGRSEFANHGQRVVVGQRIVQSSSDIFLGWTEFSSQKHFYVRQLRDTKVKPDVELWTGSDTIEAAELMGAVLARAHARSGDAAIISGYLGNDDTFDRALADFAVSYANQTEKDFERLQQAACSGQVRAIREVQ